MSNTAVGISFALGATTGASVATTFAGVSARVKTLQADMKSLRGQSAVASRLLAADSSLSDARRAHLAGPTDATRRNLQQAQSAFNSAERAAKKYNVTMADAAKTHARVTAELDKTGAALARNEKLQANQARRKDLEGQMMATVATVAVVAAPVKLAIDYESAMADVKKVTNFDAPGFKQFSEDLLAMSTRIPMSAEGLAKIAAAAGQAGIAESELLRFTEDAAKMATAFDISAEEAGSAMTGLRTNFRLNQDGVISLGDSFNQLANSMDAKAGDLVNFANRVGGTATIYGFSGQQMGALGAAFVAMKTPAEVAARATNSLMTKLGNAGEAGKDAQAAFQRLGYASGKQLADAFKRDGQGAMLQFLQVVKGSKDPMRELTAIFGEGFSDEIAKLVGGLDEYQKALGLVADNSSYAGSMQKEYEERSKPTANALELLKNSGSRLGITIGSVLLKPIAAVASTLQTVLDPIIRVASACPVLTGAVMTLAVSFAAAKLAALGGMYVWTLVHDGWLIARRGASLLWGALSKLPLLFRASTYQALWHRGVSIASAAAMKVQAAATWVVTTAQKALNLAMSSNPIGIIIKVVVAAAAALYTLYETCEPVRAAVDAVISGIKDAFWSVVKTVLGVYDKISSFFGGSGTAVADLEAYLAKTEEAGKAVADLPKATSTTMAVIPDYTETAPLTPPTSTASAGVAASAPRAVSPGAGTAAASASPPLPRPASGAAGGMSLAPQITFSINFSGVPSQDVGTVLVSAIKAKERDLSSYFEKLMEGIASNQRRVDYAHGL